jgi:hypothetical protein
MRPTFTKVTIDAKISRMVTTPFIPVINSSLGPTQITFPLVLFIGKRKLAIGYSFTDKKHLWPISGMSTSQQV